MKLSKCISVFILGIFLIFNVVSCGDDDDDSSDSSDSDDDSDDAPDDDANDDDDVNDDIDDDVNDDADDDLDDDTEEPCVGVPPGGGDLTQLFAGVAVGDLYAPVGISMGGFGLREGEWHPLATVMGGSTGYIDRLNVKAVTLDNGQDRLVIVRAPVVFISAILYGKVLNRVCELTGLDLREKLWLSGTHTHSGPSHFYPMPVPFGVTGTDTYDEIITERMADSFAQVIAASMENLEPAAMDVTVVEPFDPTDKWFHDRRCENDPLVGKEDRLFMARIDFADGLPMTALVGFPMHGTAFANTLMHSDAPGSVEYGLERTFDAPVPVLFMQGAAGDAAPRGSDGYNSRQSLERLGHTAGIALRDIFDGLTPVRDWDFEMVHKRLSVSRESIGYEPGEFGYISPLTGDFIEYNDGAFYCGDSSVLELLGIDDISIVDCDNPETVLTDGYLGCAWNNSWVPEWVWFTRETDVANIRLGDYILTLMPGELTAMLSQMTRDGIETNLAWDPAKIASFGYSISSQMYLLTSWDWMQGGYEMGMSFWGPKFGDWLAEQSAELATQFLTPEIEDNITGQPPLQTHPWAYSLCPSGLEKGINEGNITRQVIPIYERFDTVHFGWLGGYSGTGNPRVYIERQDGRAFSPVIKSDGRPLTDSGIEIEVHYEARPNFLIELFPSEREHRWSINWELDAKITAGTYRIRIEGNTWDGEQVVGYEIFSDSFEIAPSTDLIALNAHVADLGADQYRIECDGFWPPNPEGYRLRHLNYGSDQNAPIPGGVVTATVIVDGGAEETLALAMTEEGHFEQVFTMTQTGLPHHMEIRVGDLVDIYGNTNVSASEPVDFP